ncbi:MAG: dihydrodipicolinate synthase family protein [bacterium]|nr:dihydrodipicolinate synthase family protein [bacterium]
MTIDWQGVFPAVTTKFDAEDGLDLKMFQFNIEEQIKAGVDGIILGGTLGEASGLKTSEKEQLVAAVREVNSNIPIIMNIAEQTTEGAIKSAMQAENWGANGLMVLPPMRYNADQNEVFHYFKTISENSDLPMIIYNNPVDYKILVTLDTFDRLQEYSTIQGVKESTRDVSNVTRMINRFGERYSILCGVDTLAMESLLMGANGWIAGLVCAFPRETVAIYRLIKASEIQKALEIYRWFLPLLELDINSKLVQNIKLAESLTGLGTEFVRAPRLPLHGQERRDVLNIINQALDTRPSIPEYLELAYS